GSGNPPLLYLATDNTNDYSALHERSGKPIVFLNTPNGTGVATELMRIASNGNVGIGTNNPTQGRLAVIGAVSGSRPNAGAYSQMNSSTTLFQQSAGAGGQDVSIYGSHTIWAGVSVCSSSDARIKDVQGVSPAAADLATLRDIEVTNYRYKDKVGHPDREQKKVIAQQVEKVFPQAVSQRTDVVPDIFKPAPIKDGWIELKTDLKKGERVRLIDDKDTSVVHEVLEVTSTGFRTAFKPACDKVFVYGREVKDFRTVDYDAISMLNVSATQELARKLDAKDTEIAALNKRLAALEARDKARDAKLAAIEKALHSEDKPVLRTVSLK
ncbi:MAG: tail fiber domain-containing protein, partial [Prosthecobacter sp.]